MTDWHQKLPEQWPSISRSIAKRISKESGWLVDSETLAESVVEVIEPKWGFRWSDKLEQHFLLQRVLILFLFLERPRLENTSCCNQLFCFVLFYFILFCFVLFCCCLFRLVRFSVTGRAWPMISVFDQLIDRLKALQKCNSVKIADAANFLASESINFAARNGRHCAAEN